MENINIILLIAFLLSSCAPATNAVPTFMPQSTETPTPSPTETQTPSPTPTITPTPTQIGGGSGKLVFEYHKVAYEKAFPDLKGEINVFTSNWDGTDLTPVTDGPESFNTIESISPDGKMVLISSAPNYPGNVDLYLFPLDMPYSGPIKIASGLSWTRWPQSIFLDNTRIVYLGQGSQGFGFYMTNIDGTGSEKLGTPTGNTWRIVSSDKTRVYWQSIQKEYFKDSTNILYSYGDFWGMWWINIDGSGQGKLESNGHQILGERAVFSPDGTKIAWIPEEVEQGCPGAFGGFWTPDIRNGTSTKYLATTSQFFNKNSPYFGQVVDIPFIEDYARHCLLLHVAPLSNMDNDTKIPLIPPFDPAKDDFLYHRGYELRWWPDSSKILLYDGGYVSWDGNSHFPITLYEIVPNDTNAHLVVLEVLTRSSVVQPGPGKWPRLVDSFTSVDFSPDGRQVFFTRYYYENTGSMIGILNLDSMNYIDDFSHDITPDFQVRRVENIYWLP